MEGHAACRTLPELGPELAFSALQGLHPGDVLRAASSSSQLDAVCRREELWRSLVWRQWRLGGLEDLSGGRARTWREACRILCGSPEGWVSLPPPDPDEAARRFLLAGTGAVGSMSDAAQRFLLGLRTGFMPTPGGCFTYHCPSATPIHYRPTEDGSWVWSPDHAAWFPTSTTKITRGAFGPDSVGERHPQWHLVDDNEELVRHLEASRPTPLFRREVPVERPAALACHRALNRALLLDFMGAIGSLPPTTACVSSGLFTVHLLFLPALQFTLAQGGVQVAQRCRDAVAQGEAAEWADLVRMLNDMYAEISPAVQGMQQLILQSIART
mmetsp:Transcript_70169/g.217003  ORF Transcript_70169/g.217003 Transcript_70169/m.217003 type:complete len:328 (+) Transcript_70169:46-1029(+)